MSRRFLKPLFSFWDPFFTEPIYIKRILPAAPKANRAPVFQDRNEDDPNATFDNFFKDHLENTASLKPEEKAFFQKHFPEKVGRQFNPYQVLGVDKNADIDKIKEAYRTSALKYHPKNDPSPEGQQKFKNISKAYNSLVQKRTNDYGQDVSTKSFFEDFHRQMENFNKPETDQKGKEKGVESDQKKQAQTNMKAEDKKDEKLTHGTDPKAEQKPNEKPKAPEKGREKPISSMLKGAELYSESSYFELINGKRKLHVTKMYEKDGKTIKVDRVQQNKNDGTVEVTQTFDDGNQVRNKKYVEGAKKQRYLH